MRSFTIQPDWIRSKDPIADNAVLHATEQWWTSFVQQFKDEPAILAWDLLNEPSVRWNSAAMQEKWNQWLKAKYERIDNVAIEFKTSAEQMRCWK